MSGLGLTYMSNAWKEHMLAHYEFKKPAGRTRWKMAVDRG